MAIENLATKIYVTTMDYNNSQIYDVIHKQLCINKFLDIIGKYATITLHTVLTVNLFSNNGLSVKHCTIKNKFITFYFH